MYSLYSLYVNIYLRHRMIYTVRRVYTMYCYSLFQSAIIHRLIIASLEDMEKQHSSTFTCPILKVRSM